MCVCLSVCMSVCYKRRFIRLAYAINLVAAPSTQLNDLSIPTRTEASEAPWPVPGIKLLLESLMSVEVTDTLSPVGGGGDRDNQMGTLLFPQACLRAGLPSPNPTTLETFSQTHSRVCVLIHSKSHRVERINISRYNEHEYYEILRARVFSYYPKKYHNPVSGRSPLKIITVSRRMPGYEPFLSEAYPVK